MRSPTALACGRGRQSISSSPPHAKSSTRWSIAHSTRRSLAVARPTTTSHYSCGAVLSYSVTSNIYSVTLEYLTFTPDSPDPNDGERIGNPIEGFTFEIHGSNGRFDTRMILGAWPMNPNVVINRLGLFVFEKELYLAATCNPKRDSDPCVDFIEQPEFPGIQQLGTFFEHLSGRDEELAKLSTIIQIVCGSAIIVRSMCSDKLAPSQRSLPTSTIAPNMLSRPSFDIRDGNLAFARISVAPDNSRHGRDVERASGLPLNGALHPH